MGHGFKKSFVFQRLVESTTALEVGPTKMIARVNKKGKKLYTELLKAKTPADIEAIQIPAATQGQNNTNIDFTRYAPVPPFILKKFVEDNSSTPQDIIVSRVKALKAFEPTQSVIATLLNAPATTAFQNTGEAITTNKGQAGEQTEAEVSDTAEANPIIQEGLELNGQD